MPFQIIESYFNTISSIYSSQSDTEHSYRAALQQLLEAILPEGDNTIQVINEPRRAGFGAPDLVITKNDLILGYVETKQVGDGDLDGNRHNKEQFTRYKLGVGNIIFTDYLDFHFYQNTEKIAEVRIAEETGDSLRLVSANINNFLTHLRNFYSYTGETIATSEALAKIMANKSRILAIAIAKSLESDAIDTSNNINSALMSQYNTIKDNLIANINYQDYADMYSQTVVYGLFAARYNTKDLSKFVRVHINELIPASIPFLKNLFIDIAVRDLDVRIRWIIDDLVEVFKHSDIETIMANYGHADGRRDPIIHFYEDYLNEYAPELRQERGVWYTPDAVVDFIVRAVDEILQTEFNLQNGLANVEKVNEDHDAAHKVQILDPATGTGTFLAKVIDLIYDKLSNQRGAWNNYVNKHLLPRLNGFELLMASYAIAHLNIFHNLSEKGFNELDAENRTRIFLTNSLENPQANENRTLPYYLSVEANEAAKIKRNTPIMCIIGNPPYNGHSVNKDKFILDLVNSTYKKEPNSDINLQERTSRWLNDDYVKFIRLAQDYICRNGSGVVAFINPHTYLDNITFRGMRWSLLKNFNKIYSINLHGSKLENDTTNNVFSIRQGVSINILVKTRELAPNELGEMYYFDLLGTRKEKFDYLYNHSLNNIPFTLLHPEEKYYFFVPKNFNNLEAYNAGFSIVELFSKHNSGIITEGDNFIIDYSFNSLKSKINRFMKGDFTVEKMQREFRLKKNYAPRLFNNKHKIGNIDIKYYKKISYRPFDVRFTYYYPHFILRRRDDTMDFVAFNNNICLIAKRGFKGEAAPVFVSKHISESRYWSCSGMQGIDSVFPLFAYVQIGDGTYQKLSNLNCDIKNRIASSLGLKFKIDEPEEPEANKKRDYFTSVELFDYIYAVLHSPAYRQKYEEFIKIDFPRVPYPTDVEKFRKLASLGAKLRKLHLFEGNAFAEKDNPTGFPIAGDNLIEKVDYKNDRVYINNTQYFSNVSPLAWEMYVGGYQPAQKYLSDRKNRELEFDEISHYCNIIRALEETEQLMSLIDEEVPEI